jgi:hypothetical protein
MPLFLYELYHILFDISILDPFDKLKVPFIEPVEMNGFNKEMILHSVLY